MLIFHFIWCLGYEWMELHVYPLPFTIVLSWRVPGTYRCAGHLPLCRTPTVVRNTCRCAGHLPLCRAPTVVQDTYRCAGHLLLYRTPTVVQGTCPCTGHLPVCRAPTVVEGTCRCTGHLPLCRTPTVVQGAYRYHCGTCLSPCWRQEFFEVADRFWGNWCVPESELIWGNSKLVKWMR